MKLESNFEIVVTEQVGLNLQSTKKSVGAYVDSFFRSIDKDGHECMLPGESTFGTKLIGSIVSSVNGQDVSGLQAALLCKMISKADRPLKIQFFQPSKGLSEDLEQLDYSRLLEYLNELLASEVENAEHTHDRIFLLKKKFLCFIDCERILKNVILCTKGYKKQLVSFLKEIDLECLDSSLSNISDSFISNSDFAVSQITASLHKELSQNLVPLFIESVIMQRMRGYLFNSRRKKLTFSEVLCNSVTLMHFFLYLSKTNKRHVLLLCYMQLRDADLRENTLDLLILCDSVLRLCNEPFLGKERKRLEKVIRLLRQTTSPRKSKLVSSPSGIGYSHQSFMGLLVEIEDCIAWQFVVSIFPVFELSKDCNAMLNSTNEYHMSLAPETEKVKPSSEYLSLLLRSSELPNSLSVHRKNNESPDCLKNEDKKISWFATFDTFVDAKQAGKKSPAYDRDEDLVVSSITEGDCPLAQVHVRGHVKCLEVFPEKDGNNTEMVNDICDLSSFFVPTGKICIPVQNKQIHSLDDQGHPHTKLYSMVLTTRNQIPLYACSLVLYRPVLLVSYSDTIKVDSIEQTENEVSESSENSDTVIVEKVAISIGKKMNISTEKKSGLTDHIGALLSQNFSELSADTFSTMNSQLSSDSLFSKSKLIDSPDSSRESSSEIIINLSDYKRSDPTIASTEFSPEHFKMRDSDEIATLNGVMQDNHLSKKSFQEFLSATANATAIATANATANATAIASAITLQAGAMQTPKFSWTESKRVESKGFYNNLPSFLSLSFSKERVEIKAETEFESSLKRKHEGNAVKLPLHMHSEIPAILFSPNHRSSASSPRSLKSNSRSPRSIKHPYSLKNVHRKRTSRSTKGVPLKVPNRIQKTLNSPSRTSNKVILTSDTESINKSLEAISLVDLSALRLSAIDFENTTTSSSQIEGALTQLSSTTTLCNTATTERNVGKAYVAYGFCLMTEDPSVDRLRQAATAIAKKFEESYMKKSFINFENIPTGSSPSLPFCIPEDITNALYPQLQDVSNSTSRHWAPDYDSDIVFGALNPRNLVTVFLAFLLEYRIVVVSSQALSAATHLGEWLKEASSPLEYSHFYCPVVSPSIGNNLICMPSPYFIGMKRSSMILQVIDYEDEREKRSRKKNTGKKDSNCGLVIVDMDLDDVSIPEGLHLPLKSAKTLIQALESLFHPSLAKCDSLSCCLATSSDGQSLSSDLKESIMSLCNQFVASLLQGSDKYCTQVEDGDEHVVLFDESLFLQHHVTKSSMSSTTVVELDLLKEDKYISVSPQFEMGDKENDGILSKLIRTQSFSSYLTSSIQNC